MYLNYDDQDLKSATAFETAREITQQPSTWLKTLKLVQEQKEALRNFLNKIGQIGTFDIVMMGAGTSEYIGNALLHYINPMTNFSARSIPTTDLVTSAIDYIRCDRPTLFISYGRSGNSPESMGAVKAVEAVCPNPYHLYITCNERGELYQSTKTMPNVYGLLLPAETNDLGFAMTSSFSNMLLATVLVFNLDKLDQLSENVKDAASNIDHNILAYATTLQTIVREFDFKRIIYLGSESMKGYAQESCLKVLELTAGKIATLHDTLLGFRHGPKSFIDPETLVVVYLSDNPYVRRYELDLCNEIKRQQKGYRILVVNQQSVDFQADYQIQLDSQANQPMILVGLQMMIIAHILAFTKSYTMGMTTDNPCPTGEVNRVVTGVTIYPYERRLV